LVLKEGATVEFLSAGGGGRGPAYERELSRVVDDVLQGYVTFEGARRDYGVVLDANLSVVMDATKALRNEMSRSATHSSATSHAVENLKELQA
jgi:N-methylhydantoinase B